MLVKMLHWWGRVFSLTAGICAFEKLTHQHGAASWSWFWLFLMWALVCHLFAESIDN
jgi:hypothetical protein